MSLDNHAPRNHQMVPMNSLAYGPVPSRRLGMSLGVNNIPPKVCSYSCVYCQLGITPEEDIVRREFFDLHEISRAVENRVKKTKLSGGRVDYITFVPDGEPTLDKNLGTEIESLKETGIKIAVITNSSLLWMKEVRENLMLADWVSLKVDTVDTKVWKKINRPSRQLSLEAIMDGQIKFSKEFPGTLTTETMLVSGLNDGVQAIRETGKYINELKPQTAYLSVPTRPPAESWVKPPDEFSLNRAYQVMSSIVEKTECITGYEGNLFTYTGDIVEDITGVASVHPIRREGVEDLLQRSGESWELIERMISEGLISEVEYNGIKFYMRKFTE